MTEFIKLIDENRELAGWFILLSAVVLCATGVLPPLYFVASEFLGVLTMLGAAYFRGLSLKSVGLEVK